jgi:hypothetical protein
MNPLHADLLAVVDAVEIDSPTAYRFLGQARDLSALATAPAEGGDPPTGVIWLGNDLYGGLYTRPLPGPLAAAGADWLVRRDFVASLSAANSGRGTWEPGWTIREVDEDGRIAAVKDDLTFWVMPAGLRPIAGRIEAGASCRVWVAKEIRNLMPGFYVAIGNGEGDPEPAPSAPADDPLVRYYWHLTPGTAAPFLAAATATLNALDVPFRVKVLSDPDAYRRADAGVLYLRRRYVGRIGDAVARIHGAVAGGLRPESPLFTKPLAPGLGLAEDEPEGRRSFGQHRCHLAATALWSAFHRGLADRDARAEEVATTFRRAGLDPARPYLEPRSRDDYALHPPTPRRRRRRRPAPPAAAARRRGRPRS